MRILTSARVRIIINLHALNKEMAQYTNLIPGTCITVNTKQGHVKISHGETKELEATAFVEGLVKRGKLAAVKEAKPASKPQQPKVAAPVNDNSNQS